MTTLTGINIFTLGQVWVTETDADVNQIVDGDASLAEVQVFFGTDWDSLLADYTGYLVYGLGLALPGGRTLVSAAAPSVNGLVDSDDFFLGTNSGTAGGFMAAYGGLGADTVIGFDGDDLLVGGSDDDFLSGGRGDDKLYGDWTDVVTFSTDLIDPSILTVHLPLEDASLTGDDVIEGATGDDTIWGGAGDDSLSGGSGGDTIYGGDGDDVIRGYDGADTMYGFFDFSTGDLVTVSWTEDDGVDWLYGGDGDDQIYGGPRGDGFTDNVWGGDGADLFFLSYAELASSDDAGTNFWTGWQSEAVVAGRTVVTNGIAAALKAAENAFFSTVPGGFVLNGIASGIGFLAAQGLNTALSNSTAAAAPSTAEDVLKIYDFDPRYDMLILPGDDTATMDHSVDFSDDTDYPGYVINFNHSVSGDTYAKVYVADDYFDSFGLSRDSSAVEALLELIFANRLIVDSSGVKSGGTYAFSTDPADYEDGVVPTGLTEALDLAASSGVTLTIYGAMTPQAVYGPAVSSTLAYLGGTQMGDILSVNAAGISPDDLASSALLTSTAAHIRGFEGDDVIFGGNGVDSISGDEGDDIIFGVGHEGVETQELFYGGAGNDLIHLGWTSMSALVDGGIGTDEVSFEYADGPVTLDMTADSTDALTAANAHTTHALSGLVSNYALANVEAVTGTDDDDVMRASDLRNTTLNGGEGADTLTGGAKTDHLYGGDGDDSLDGGASRDHLFGGAGDDSLLGGFGNDYLYGDDGADTIDGGTDADGADIDVAIAELAAALDLTIVDKSFSLVDGSGATDVYTNTEGLRASLWADTVTGDDGINMVLGWLGDDTLSGMGGADILDGGDGADEIYGGAGDDTLYGGTTSNAWNYGGGFLDVADTIHGGDDDDYIDGGEGGDTLFGDAGDDSVFGGDGDDVIYGGDGAGATAGADSVDGGEGDDEIFSGAGGLTATGGDGDDTLDASTGTASLLIGDSLTETTAVFDAGAWGDDTLVGSGEGDTIHGGFGDDLVAGGAGDDTIYAGSGADSVDGGADDDLIQVTMQVYGASGAVAATVDGGAGDDALVLATSALDTGTLGYVVDLAAGTAELVGWSGGVATAVSPARTVAFSGIETLVGSAGIDLISGADGDDVIYGGDGDDTVFASLGDDTLYGGDGENDVLDLAGVVTTFSAWDGTFGDVTMTVQDLSGTEYTLFFSGFEAVANYVGDTAQNGVFYGGDGDNVVVDQDYDWVYGGGGDDTLTNSGNVAYGGDGDDALDYSGVTEISVGLWGDAGNDVLIGADQPLSNYYIDLLYGGDDDDSLYGGAGKDSLYGGGGDDWFMGGDGVAANKKWIYGGDGSDTVTYAHIVQTGLHYAVNLQMGPTGAAYINGNTVSDKVGDVENAIGSEYGDWLDGSTGSAARTLLGMGGDDSIDGGAGADSLSGGEGADTLAGNDGADSIDGGIGADSIDGGSGDDVIAGGEGDDVIAGGVGDDTLVGGAGADVIDGGFWDDVIIWNHGDGADVIDGGFDDDTLILNLDDGVEGFEDVTFALNDASDGVVVTVGEVAFTFTNIEEIVINADSDGSYIVGSGNLTLAGVAENTIRFHGGKGNDHFDGSAIDGVRVIVHGRRGDDTLLGGAGHDILYGGKGDDTKYGGGGSNMFVGDPEDFLDEGFIGDFGEGDLLRIRNHGNGAELGKVVDGAAKLKIDVDGDGIHESTITLHGDFVAAERKWIRVEDRKGDLHIQLDTPVATEAILDGGEGTDGDDLLYGSDKRDVLSGHGGADLLDGNARADALYGGADDDTIRGEGGDDAASGGSGDDSLFGGDGHDRIEGDGGADEIFGGDGGDSLFGGTGADLLEGADGADALFGGAGADDLYGAAGADELYGGSGADDLRGGLRKDLLDGGEGDDALRGEAGADVLSGGAGADVLRGGRGTDLASYADAEAGVVADLSGGRTGAGEAEGDVYHGIEGLLGSGHDDRLIGDDADNSLSGGAGDDILVGGLGADRLSGDAGSDLFVYLDAADSDRTLSDVILDFEHGLDRIDLSAIDANALTGAEDAFAYIADAAFSGTAGELRLATAAGGGLRLKGDLDGDGAADLLIRLSGPIALGEDDLVL
ncbi:M10 family metallopeptidase C-terminal domain-containing protein [Albimonas sp. CAU 1670]|uniref:calcium-binding protein n=1 Tax=Albimonas sp. CAU 1670 TaxID=3032599 RepID=UPI0023DB9710|nr:M10 family metallopeptidase C-terminal domain-containing protein [Albimonas sp. CAU 1670]MDF2235095.1 M10 family metallopeptidase C-terminal domain-containing protein [Albimonas sp. CAU 1670]